MWLEARATAHEGTSPAGAMVTPFAFPCGSNFINEQHQQDKAMKERCAPPGFEEYWFSSVGYYSPAICPRGYTAGCMRWNSDQGPALEPTETAVQCVPEGYVCNTMHISMAYSYSATVPMIQVRWAETDLPSFATHPLWPGANPTNHELRGNGIDITRAPGLVARQASSGGLGSFGSEIFPPATDTSTIDTSIRSTGDGGTGFPKFTATGLPGSGGGGSGGGGGLSTGAKAGIAVGVTVPVLLLIGAAIFFFCWRRRKPKQSAAQGPPPNIPHPNMTELEPGGKFELPAGQSTTSPTVVGSELGVKDGKSELATYSPSPAGGQPTELSSGGSWHRYSGTAGWVPEMHGQERSPHSELPPESRPAEMDSTQAPPSAKSAIQRKQVASPVQQEHQPSAPWQAPVSPPDSGPDTRVSILPSGMSHTASPISPALAGSDNMEQQQQPPPTEPSPQEFAALQEQHAQLEGRRRRILELEQIERDQAALEERMKTMRGSQGQG